MFQILNTPLLIDWNKFTLGASMFIPCLNRVAVERYIIKECSRMQFTVVTRRVVENKKYGVRVWRTV